MDSITCDASIYKQDATHSIPRLLKDKHVDTMVRMDWVSEDRNDVLFIANDLCMSTYINQFCTRQYKYFYHNQDVKGGGLNNGSGSSSGL